MGYQRVKRTGHYVGNEDVFVCDTPDDIQHLPAMNSGEDYVPFGSWAEVVSNGAIYRLNSAGEWCLQPKNTGGGTMETVSIVPVETDDYLASYKVYQGDVLVGTINVPLPTIEDGSISAVKLDSSINAVLDADVTDEGGSHKMRYYNNALEVNDGNSWKKVKADGLAL